ncbi:hypothetical protein DSO57_1022221 [Entomophthora muscae]|uniref:Uncharacterized protein n=1 Tax=Entomophthora muscae TaxID=34485 RepID=A0ACC2U1Y0_9FUNG|nr:hypothetical protein DSO57_1022221 [Entomophthora muscae]
MYSLTFIFTSIIALVSGETIEGSYIIKLRGETRISIDTHLDLVRSMFNNRAAGNEIKTVYRNLDSIYTRSSTVMSWRKLTLSLGTCSHLTRDKAAGSSTRYAYAADGTGVFVYVVDTGIMVDHPEFEDRASFGSKFAGSNNKEVKQPWNPK